MHNENICLCVSLAGHQFMVLACSGIDTVAIRYSLVIADSSSAIHSQNNLNRHCYCYRNVRSLLLPMIHHSVPRIAEV